MAETTDFHSFEEFWPFYVGEHKDPTNRALHYVGTSLAIGTVGAAVITWNPLWLLATPVVGYAPAWIGHFVIEGNRPATFKHPLWSIRGDLRMLKMALQGKIKAEIERVARGDAGAGANGIAGENGVAHHENGVHPAPDATASA
ncbi:MAG: hypothetical protein JWM74_47 [Myxococcaceae bacterium]|nr:hypothetical protein [Myxococcaceae bacterium]